jgi:hypothetical protein
VGRRGRGAAAAGCACLVQAARCWPWGAVARHSRRHARRRAKACCMPLAAPRLLRNPMLCGVCLCARACVLCMCLHTC